MIALKLEKRWNRVSICRTPERQKGEPSNSSKVLRMLHRLFIAACLFSLPILCWPDPADGPKSSGFTLRPLCPVSHCPIEDKGGLLANRNQKRGEFWLYCFSNKLGFLWRSLLFAAGMQEAAIGKDCHHIQVFDLHSSAPQKSWCFYSDGLSSVILSSQHEFGEPLWMPHNNELALLLSEVHHRNVSAKFVNEICHRQSSLKAGLSPSPQTPHTFYL